MKKTGDYVITTELFSQPVDHAQPGERRFAQRVKLLTPAPGVPKTKMLFIMGLESALDDKWLTGPYAAFGKREDMLILCAEHRGYGPSVSGDWQSCPDYISVPAALADYHAVRQHYAARFPGLSWLLYGCSYGGGLVIDYAHRYPEDAGVLICSSGVVDWRPMLPEYDIAARENLGPALYERLCRHIDALSPAEPFGENWYGRELIYAFVTGLCQYRENNRLLGLIGAAAKLPTRAFIALLGGMDAAFTGGAAGDYARSNAAASLSREQAVSCRYSWRVWRYQQAFMTGTFWAASGPRSIYRRDEADWARECQLLFGREPTVFRQGTGWDVRGMVPQLQIPMVYVIGDRDPWRRVGLEPDYPLKKGRVLVIKGGFHGPDRYPDTGPAVLAAALEYLKGAN